LTHAGFNIIPSNPARAIALGALLLALAGCYHPAFVSPEPLDAGDFCAGIAVTGLMTPSTSSGAIVSQGAARVRYGFGSGFDAGIRLAVPDGPCADVKWNLLKAPFLPTTDVGGASYAVTVGMPSEFPLDTTLRYGIYPAVLVGTRVFFGGIRLSAQYSLEAHGPNRSGWSYWPALLAGASAGDRARIMPGIEVVLVSGEPILFATVGLQFHARPREPAVEQY